MKNVCIYFKLECSFLLIFYLVKQLGRKSQTDKRVVLTNTMVQSATHEHWIGVGLLYIYAGIKRHFVDLCAILSTVGTILPHSDVVV